MANLTVTMVPVTLPNVSKLVITKPGANFSGTSEYVVVDSVGTIWKNNRYTFGIGDGTQTLNQMVATMLAGINQQEGMA